MWAGWGAGGVWDGRECRLAWGGGLGVSVVKGYPHSTGLLQCEARAVTGWERDILNPAPGSPSRVRVSYTLGVSAGFQNGDAYR